MAGRKQSIYIILVAALGIIALVGIAFLTYTRVDDLRSARDTVAAEQAAVAGAEAQLQSLIKARDQASVLKKRLDAFDRLIPAEPKESALINEIQGMADGDGVRFLQIRFEKRAPKQGYVEMPVKIAFQGRYHGLLALLDNLQNGDRAVRIDEVKVGKGKEELPQIKAEVTASAFFIQEGAVKGKEGS